MKGIISDVKRFTVQDGPGIRTTLFLKGCPLKCLWCHNPETLAAKPVLSYTEKLCIACGDCMPACDRGCHTFNGAGPEYHCIDRKNCECCGACVEECMPGALKIYGREIEPEDAAEILLEDAPFYTHSGGGATFSGGEPLLQPDFCAKTMSILKLYNIHIAVDTCGDVAWGSFEPVLEYADLFLYDLKHINAAVLKKWSGGSANRIIDNMKMLNSRGKSCELRIPVIPGFNDDDKTLLKMGSLAASLPNIVCVRLLAYHNMSGVKYDEIGMRDRMPETIPPTARRMAELKDMLGAVCPNVRLSGEI